MHSMHRWNTHTRPYTLKWTNPWAHTESTSCRKTGTQMKNGWFAWACTQGTHLGMHVGRRKCMTMSRNGRAKGRQYQEMQWVAEKGACAGWFHLECFKKKKWVGDVFEVVVCIRHNGGDIPPVYLWCIMSRSQPTSGCHFDKMAAGSGLGTTNGTCLIYEIAGFTS